MSLSELILYQDQLALIQQALNSGMAVNEIDDYGLTPLIEAVLIGRADMVKLLLDYQADVNLTDTTGRTPLHWAVDNGDLELCQLLLAAKANPNAYTYGGEPILVNPLLRNQGPLKRLLYQYRADLNFAYDFINTKLLAHRFELTGYVDIVDYQGKFFQLELEGFFLEFTVSMVLSSLRRYRNNFAARVFRPQFNHVQKLLSVFASAEQLLRYQHHTVNLKDHDKAINTILAQTIMLLPIAYQGHAISLIKCGNLLAICDRGEHSKVFGSVVIFEINNLQQFNLHLVKDLLYKKQHKAFIEEGIYRLLGLKPLKKLAVKPQITGNCSWANIEAAIPVILFMLSRNEAVSMHFYQQWAEWDKGVALNECLQGFTALSAARKAMKATLLGAVLFQSCKYPQEKDLAVAEKILPILLESDYRYILESYLEVYYKTNKTPEGTNLVKILRHFDVDLGYYLI